MDQFPLMGVPDTGDTAWILASSALVLLMTPGLAFFHGGMVRAKGVLNTLMMSPLAAGSARASGAPARSASNSNWALMIHSTWSACT